MSVYKRYFRFSDGPLVAEIDRLFEARAASAALYQKVADKCGAAETKIYDRSGSFAGFVFTVPPDTSVYRRCTKTRLWLPRKNVPAGKAIWAELRELPNPESIQTALRLANLEPGMPMLMDGGHWYAPVLWGYGAPRNIWFVSVPWKDVDPDELAAYRSDGGRFDRDLDALSWQPPAEWVEVKSWQIEKECEELKCKS